MTSLLGAVTHFSPPPPPSLILMFRRTHPTGASDGRIRRAHQTGASDGRIRRAHQTGASDGRIRRAHQTGASDGRTRRTHETDAPDGRFTTGKLNPWWHISACLLTLLRTQNPYTEHLITQQAQSYNGLHRMTL